MSQEQRTSPPPDIGMNFSSVEAFRESLGGFYGMCSIPGSGVLDLS
jgi:hypothetical protein